MGGALCRLDGVGLVLYLVHSLRNIPKKWRDHVARLRAHFSVVRIVFPNEAMRLVLIDFAVSLRDVALVADDANDYILARVVLM